MKTDWITERIDSIGAQEDSLKDGFKSYTPFTVEKLTTTLLSTLVTYRYDLEQLRGEIQKLRGVLINLHTTCEEALNGIEEETNKAT